MAKEISKRVESRPHRSREKPEFEPLLTPADCPMLLGWLTEHALKNHMSQLIAELVSLFGRNVLASDWVPQRDLLLLRHNWYGLKTRGPFPYITKPTYLITIQQTNREFLLNYPAVKKSMGQFKVYRLLSGLAFLLIYSMKKSEMFVERDVKQFVEDYYPETTFSSTSNSNVFNSWKERYLITDFEDFSQEEQKMIANFNASARKYLMPTKHTTKSRNDSYAEVWEVLMKEGGLALLDHMDKQVSPSRLESLPEGGPPMVVWLRKRVGGSQRTEQELCNFAHHLHHLRIDSDFFRP